MYWIKHIYTYTKSAERSRDPAGSAGIGYSNVRKWRGRPGSHHSVSLSLTHTHTHTLRCTFNPLCLTPLLMHSTIIHLSCSFQSTLLNQRSKLLIRQKAAVVLKGEKCHFGLYQNMNMCVFLRTQGLNIDTFTIIIINGVTSKRLLILILQKI